MSRLVAGAVWLAVAALFAVGAVAGLWPDPANAYLCGWLALISLPLGALALLMALEAAGAGEAAIAGPLRLILASLPVLALLFVPLLVGTGRVYGWAVACGSAPCPPFAYAGLGARWFTHEAFALRGVGYLVVWLALSVYFLRPASPSPGRHALALCGLMLHLVVGTLAAMDWFMSLDAGHVTANYGVLVLSAQSAFALTAALLISVSANAVPERGALFLLLALLGVAVFTQFVEFLVVWSANLPKEIAWYQARAGGRVFAVAGPALLFCGAGVLASGRVRASRMLVGIVLGAFLLVELGDLVLLASPKRLFPANLSADLLAVVALGGLAAACARVVGGRNRQRLRHG